MTVIEAEPLVKDKYRGTLQYAKVRWMLIAAAQTRKLVTYPDVAALIGITEPGQHMAGEVGKILGEIAEDEVQNGYPMLSAVVVKTNAVRPSQGFYDLAQPLGLIASKKENLEFWLAQLQQCFERY